MSQQCRRNVVKVSTKDASDFDVDEFVVNVFDVPRKLAGEVERFRANVADPFVLDVDCGVMFLESERIFYFDCFIESRLGYIKLVSDVNTLQGRLSKAVKS